MAAAPRKRSKTFRAESDPSARFGWLQDVRRHTQLVVLCGARLTGELAGTELVVQEELLRPEGRRLPCEEAHQGRVIRRRRGVLAVLVGRDAELPLALGRETRNGG